MSLFSEPPRGRLLRCEVPGCTAADEEGTLPRHTCVIWGGHRICYPHFDAFAEHPLSFACEKHGGAPTAAEWAAFLKAATVELRAEGRERAP